MALRLTMSRMSRGATIRKLERARLVPTRRVIACGGKVSLAFRGRPLLGSHTMQCGLSGFHIMREVGDSLFQWWHDPASFTRQGQGPPRASGH